MITNTAAADRRELLRALGAVASSAPPFCHKAAAALGLAEPTAAEHTAVFVLSAPPHAAIYLGAEGKLGGEALDRVAGFWRVLRLTPSAEPDHLGALLILYAELGDAEAAAHSERTRQQLRHAREAMLWEHLWSWAPGYLTAVSSLAAPSLSQWARFTLRALSRETQHAAAPASLPLALRSAPAALRADRHAGARMVRDSDDGRLLDALLTPVRSGLIVTREDLRDAASAAGVGYRLGERRYTLQAMLSQDAATTLGWLASLASQWADWHAAQQPVDGADPRLWWAGRAQHTAMTLADLQRQLVAAG